MEKYIVSARKYRPSTFSAVVGQSALTATLKNAVATDRLAHSYLFCGSRGVGKTSCARIFAKTINCTNRTPDGEACNECESCRDFNSGTSMNIVELDAASNNGVDDMRKLIEQVQVMPSVGRYRVFIVDEVHMLSNQAFNAFLKTLEEPPEYVVFILATTEKHKIIPTILSRCQIYDFHRITVQDMVQHLQHVAQSEGITAEPAALNVIAVKADGAMRDALSIFDQLAASSGGNITYQSAIDNLNELDRKYYSRLLDTFLQGDVLASWVIYNEIREKGFDSQFFINGLAAYLRDLMLATTPGTIDLIEADDASKRELARQAVKCSPPFLYKAMSLCNDADLNYRQASNKQFLVEVTLAKICQQPGPSHSDDGSGEGRLKLIAAETSAPLPTAEPEQKSRPVVQQTAVPVTASAPMALKPRSFEKTSGRTVGLRTPGISIKHPSSGDANSDTGASVSRGARNTPFVEGALLSVWDDYIASHPKDHILVNTMRAAPPSLVAENRFRIEVQNPIQLEQMELARPKLLKAIHEALSNDLVDYEVCLSESASPRHTLNDAELLAQLRSEFPVLDRMITDFHLHLS